MIYFLSIGSDIFRIDDPRIAADSRRTGMHRKVVGSSAVPCFLIFFFSGIGCVFVRVSVPL